MRWVSSFNLSELYNTKEFPGRNIMKVDDLSAMFWRISGIVHNEVGILGGKVGLYDTKGFSDFSQFSSSLLSWNFKIISLLFVLVRALKITMCF